MLRLRGAPRSRRPHHFLHRAESEAATLAASAATVRSALAELQSDAKRARVEEADDEPPPLTNELPCQWGISTFRTQEQWTAKRRAAPITEGAKQLPIQRLSFSKRTSLLNPNPNPSPSPSPDLNSNLNPNPNPDPDH